MNICMNEYMKIIYEDEMNIRNAVAIFIYSFIYIFIYILKFISSSYIIFIYWFNIYMKIYVNEYMKIAAAFLRPHWSKPTIEAFIHSCSCAAHIYMIWYIHIDQCGPSERGGHLFSLGLMFTWNHIISFDCVCSFCFSPQLWV